MSLSIWRRWLLNIFQLLWLKGDDHASVGACANRRWRRFMAGPIEVTILYRDTRLDDGYSREELLEMLQTVRKHEARLGWKVPEPKGVFQSNGSGSLRRTDGHHR